MSGAAYVPLNTRPYGGHERLLALTGSPERVLDVGCSSGYLARRLVERGATVIGIDTDEQAAAEARAVCEQVLVGDVESMELPFPEQSFDVVLCGDVIEHMRDPALPRLAVHPYDGLVPATHIGRIDRQIRHIPRHIAAG